MLEAAARETCLKTLRDPVTNEPFALKDVIELVPMAYGFAASGDVIAKKYRPSFN